MKSLVFGTDPSVCLPLSNADMSRDMPTVTTFEFTQAKHSLAGALLASVSSNPFVTIATDDPPAIPFPGIEICRLAAAATVYVHGLVSAPIWDSMFIP